MTKAHLVSVGPLKITSCCSLSLNLVQESVRLSPRGDGSKFNVFLIAPKARSQSTGVRPSFRLMGLMVLRNSVGALNPPFFSVVSPSGACGAPSPHYCWLDMSALSLSPFQIALDARTSERPNSFWSGFMSPRVWWREHFGSHHVVAKSPSTIGTTNASAARRGKKKCTRFPTADTVSRCVYCALSLFSV